MQSPPPVMFPPRGPAHGSFPLRTPEVPVPTPVEDHTDRANLTSVDLESHQFRKATKEITKPEQIQTVWLKSQAYQDLLGFLQAMSNKVNNVKITDNYPVSKTVESLVSMLDDAHKWIKDIPPTEQPQRFGNMAYREWFDKLLQETPVLLHTILEEKFHPAIEEISSYFTDSFGNRTRIDYGTGHEMTFVAFLICLYKIGALVEDDAIAIVLRVFQKYLIVVRALQLTYRMEPAGSQGVWSLDDYQFISFIWGSAQFIGNKRLKPKCFTDEAICEAYHKDYIFLGCINYINSVKTGPFAEHSNQLWNISGTPLWQKVNTGLIKMYKAEVLCKFPVIQHFLCGSLLTSAPVTKTAPTQTAPTQMAPTQTAPMQTAPTQTAPTQSDNDSAGNT